eukprot:183441_1
MAPLSPKQLIEICRNEIVPQIGHKMLTKNTDSIYSFFTAHALDSDALFSIKHIDLRDLLINHSSNKIQGGPANQLLHALKERVNAHKPQSNKVTGGSAMGISFSEYFSNLNIETFKVAPELKTPKQSGDTQMLVSL